MWHRVLAGRTGSGQLAADLERRPCFLADSCYHLDVFEEGGDGPQVLQVQGQDPQSGLPAGEVRYLGEHLPAVHREPE